MSKKTKDIGIKKGTLFVAFSGGRTSGFMCRWILDNWSDKYNLIFIFCNTSLEHSGTYDFVNECDKRFGLTLVWLEAIVGEVGVGIRHKIVNYETASRNGEVFKAMCAKHGVPNPAHRFCSTRLKTEVAESYKVSLGFNKHHLTAVGYRADEVDRMSVDKIRAKTCIYPLIKNRPIFKAEIRHWWAMQDFDLGVPEHLGNCKTCWKKSDRKLFTIAKNNPDYFREFEEIENEYGGVKSDDFNRVFFRGNRSVSDVFREAGSTHFADFKDEMPELQLRLLDPIDLSGDCGDGACEIY